MTTIPEVDFIECSALIVVDVQNDFADPNGGLYVDGDQDVIPTINQLAGAARQAGALVVYTQDWHPPATPHFDKGGGGWPVHCVQGTWGAELHPEVDVDGPVVRKGSGEEDGYSGFYARDVTLGEEKPTELQAVLEERDIMRVVVVGLALDVCVKATALDAQRLGYDTTVLVDATRAVNAQPGDDSRAIATMSAAGIAVR